MKNLILLSLCFFMVSNILAQKNTPPLFTPAEKRTESYQQRLKLKEASLAKNLAFRSVGPSVFGGRITDLDVYESDPSHFYVAYASAGLWKTENNGTSFEPLFEKEAVMTIGDIAVNWKDSIIWVGTGEVNSSRSSYAGNGIYKSTDNGKTWQYLGLGESHHIARIVLHPTNPDIAWVAAMGHLYSNNKERGIFYTDDGGKTWTHQLALSDNAGVIDLIIDPENPNVLYSATWHRERRSWNFVEAGIGSDIYGTTNGGKNWGSITSVTAGLPKEQGLGRIGLALHKKEGKSTLYALLDNYNRRPKEDKKETKDELSKEALREMTKAKFLKLETKKIETYLKDNNFPEKYTTEKVIEMVATDALLPSALVEYLEDANSLLFDTPVVGAEIYKYEESTRKWKKTHDDYLDFVYNSYGYYFGQIRVAPQDPNKLYFAGVPVLRSDDGGKTFTNINRENVHVDHHAIWVNPNRAKHLILGNDGGVNISYDDGETWVKCNTPAVGQFYAVAVDMAEPYNIYGGLQDNGVWVGPSTYKASRRWHNTGHYPYKELLGGDGMQIAIDNRDNNTVYTGFQFGWYYRINKNTGARKLIKPMHELGERPLRFNWQTPIHLSVHNQDVLYLGANKLYRSLNQGDDWTAISDDLTKGGRKGDIPYGTITSVDESPFNFGVLYVGTDDGYIHISKDGGNSWKLISAGLPEDMWVSRVYASRHEEGTVYASLNGYRWDDFTSYIFVSYDYGVSWDRLGMDLPLEPVNVIKEDPENPKLIYVGTDNGLYCSLDGGWHFMLMDKDLPAVSVHDLVIHPRENDLVVGTHGRSIYVANVSHLQALTKVVQAKELHTFALESLKRRDSWGNKPNFFVESYEPEMQLPFYCKTAGEVKITVKSAAGRSLHSFTHQATKGLNYATYKLNFDKKQAKALRKELKDTKVEAAENEVFYLPKGTYTISYQWNGKSLQEELILE